MLKSILKWSFKIEERQIDLFLENDTPLSNIRELANYLLSYCQQVEDQVKAQQEAKKQEEIPEEALHVE